MWIIKIIKIECFYPPRILNEHWCIYSCLQIPPKENWFQHVRNVYATAFNFPCIIYNLAFTHLWIHVVHSNIHVKLSVELLFLSHFIWRIKCTVFVFYTFSWSKWFVSKYLSSKDCKWQLWTLTLFPDYYYLLLLLLFDTFSRIRLFLYTKKTKNEIIF